MSDIASLGVKIDSTDATRASTNLDKLTAAGARTEESAKRVQRSWEAAVQRTAAEMNTLNGRVNTLNGTQTKMLAAVERVAAQMDRMAASYERSARAAEYASKSYGQVGRQAGAGASGVDHMNRSLATTERTATAAGASIRRHLLVALSGLSAMRLIDQADQWGQYASRIKMATESAAEYDRVQARMVESANATYRNIDETRESFIQLSPVLRQMGMTLDQSMDAIDAFSGLMVTNAASAERGADAMRALSVSLQKGKVDADQWISIYSTLDSIVDSIAAHSGMAEAEIRKLGASGKLSVELIAQSLAGQYSQIMQQVEDMPTTVRDAMQNVGNAFSEYIGRANETNQVTATMASGIQVLGDNLETILNVSLVAATVGLTRYAAGLGVAVAQTVAKSVQTRLAAAEELKLAQAQVAQATATMAQTRAMAGLTTTMAQQIAAAEALQAANARLAAAQAGVAAAGRSLLGILGGPVGIAITAGLAATAFMTMGGNAQAASLNVDALAGSLDELNKRQLELRRFELEDEVKRLEEQATGSGQILRTLQVDVAALAERYGEASEGMDNARRALAEQEEAHNQNSAALDRVRLLLDQVVGRLQNLDGAARGAAGAVNALNMAFTEDGGKYLEQIQKRIKALQDGGDPVKMATRWLNDHADASEADKIAIMSAAMAEKALQEARDRAAKSTKVATSAINDAKKAAEAFEKSRRQYIDGLYDEISSLDEQARGLAQQIQLFGRAESAVYDYTIAQLEQEKAALAIMGADNEQVKILERKIALYQQMKSSAITLEGLEADKRAWEQWSRDVEQVFQQVGQSFTDYLFDSGKSARDMIKDLFKNLTLRVLVQPVMGALQGAVTSSLGGLLGYSNPSQGGGVLGMANNASSLYSAVNGGLTGNVSNAIGYVGEKLGSVALQNFAAGMVGGLPTAVGSGLAASLGTTIGTQAASAMATTTFSASLGASGAAAGGAAAGAASGAAGFGAAFGAALPWIGGALAIGSLLAGSFGGESRHGGSYNWTPGAGTVRGKWDDGDPGAEANQAISSILDGAVNAINSAFKGVGSEAGLSYFMGWAESSEKGRGGTASGGRLAIDGREVAFGTTRKGQGYGSTSGDLSEMIQNMTVDVYQTVIQAWQTGIDEFPQLIQDMIRGIDADSLSAEAAQALITQVQQTIDQVNALTAAFEQMPFEKLKGLSFDATASLLQLSGGVESFVAAHDAYYQAVYSEQERLDQQRRDVEQALGGLNMTMPQTQAQYRALVESLDLNTQAGREAYTTLISLAPTWSSVTEEMARAAQEASAAALALSTLRDGTIDMQALARQLADVSESTFVQAMAQVFESLASRLSTIIDGIANERSAVQSAIRQINDLGAMTPEQILAQVAGINTTLPGSGGLLASQQALQAAMAAQASAGGSLTSAQNRAAMGQGAANSANALVAQRANELAAAQNYLADRQATANRELTGKERLEQWAFGDIFGDSLLPDDIKQARQDLPGAQAGVERAAQLLQAAQAAAQAASVQAGAANSLLDTIRKAKEAADTQYEQASKAAQQAQLDYADAMQDFAIDAGKSVSKLSSLREETLRYYEAQAALANLMKTSADSLRKTVLDYRVSQLNPDDRFTYLQSEFEKAYSMALSTEGEELAGYADKLSSMLNPLIEQANNTFGSQASLDSFIATALARAKNIAERADALTPTDYAADSLDVLNQIDATLAALEASTRSAEQIMVDAINAGRDATVNGLRQVVNALTGKSVAAFATGAAFTNGIVSRPTAFDIGVMGEASPEAIMPLANIGGKLGVRALGGNQDLLIEMRALRQSNEALQREVANLRIEARATAVNTHKIAKQGDRNEVDGVKVRTDANEPIDVRVTA